MSRKRIMLFLVVLIIAISILACVLGSTDSSPSSSKTTTVYGEYPQGTFFTGKECERAWDRLPKDLGVNTVVDDIIHRTQIPGTVGEAVKVCIMGGWQGWRP